MNEQEIFRKMQAAHGKRGGQTTYKRYGRDHMSKLGKKSAKRKKANKNGKTKVAKK